MFGDITVVFNDHSVTLRTWQSKLAASVYLAI